MGVELPPNLTGIGIKNGETGNECSPIESNDAADPGVSYPSESGVARVVSIVKDRGRA